MKSSLLLTILAALLSIAAFATGAQAGVISRDWKASGDGLLTYDDVNKREWLDLSESRLSNFPGSTGSDRYQSVLSALLPGESLEGFIAANSSDLRELALSAGINTTSLEFNNEQPTRQLIALVGSTASFPVIGREFATSLLDDFNAPPPQPSMLLFGDVLVVPTSQMNGAAGLIIRTSIEPFQIAGLGVWLYRNEVPEPSAFILAVVCLLARGGLR